MTFYVDITGIPVETLEFVGYILVDESDTHMLLVCKGEPHVVDKDCPRLLVHDLNDARIFQSCERIPAPPSRKRKGH